MSVFPRDALVSVVAVSGGAVDRAGGRVWGCGILKTQNDAPIGQHRGLIYSRSSDRAALRGILHLLNANPPDLKHYVVGKENIMPETAGAERKGKLAQDEGRFRYALIKTLEIDLGPRFNVALQTAKEVLRLAVLGRIAWVPNKELWDDDFGPMTFGPA